MTDEGEFPKSDGDILYDGDVNDYLLNKIAIAPYTGTGFNSTKTNQGNDEQDHELTAITDGISGKTYAVIEITGYSKAVDVSSSASYVQLKIQTKDVGGSYSDSMSYKTIIYTLDNSNVDVRTTQTVKWVHTLTADEKTNGIQVKVFSKSIVGAASASASASFTNIQTVLKLSN